MGGMSLYSAKKRVSLISLKIKTESGDLGGGGGGGAHTPPGR